MPKICIVFPTYNEVQYGDTAELSLALLRHRYDMFIHCSACGFGMYNYETYRSKVTEIPLTTPLVYMMYALGKT